MKAHEIKYLMLLHHLGAQPGTTQAQLARLSDMPTALVNRYLRRLAAWGMLRALKRSKTKYELTPKGKSQLDRASWQLLAFTCNELMGLRQTAVRQLARCVAEHGWSRAVLYGATPVAEVLRDWAAQAGIDTVALCDEERTGNGLSRLGDLAGLQYDCIILSDWGRADDAMLMRLLREYGPVINLFATDGRAVPEWR